MSSRDTMPLGHLFLWSDWRDISQLIYLVISCSVTRYYQVRKGDITNGVRSRCFLWTEFLAGNCSDCSDHPLIDRDGYCILI